MGDSISSQKKTLRAVLIERGWELASVTSGDSWDVDEVWTARSVRASWGFELELVFRIVDYGDLVLDGIEAHTPGAGRDEKALAYLPYRNHFNEQLPAFLQQLDALRFRASSDRGSSL